MKQPLSLFAALALFPAYPPVFGQRAFDAETVYTCVELRKDTLLVGEPAFIELSFVNSSPGVLYVEEGGDYRSGKNVSFRVHIVSEKGDTLKEREVWGDLGGFIRYVKLLPGTYSNTPLFLPMWGKIPEAGRYTVTVSKNYRITDKNPFLNSEERWFDYVSAFPDTCSASFVAIRDDKKLGAFIEQLVAQIKTETKGRILESGSFKTGRNTYIQASAALCDNVRILSEIEDERVVPFLIESLREEKYIPREKANYLLTRFPDSEPAFEALKYAASGAPNSRCRVSVDTIALVWSIGDVRQTALGGILRHHSKKAVPFLVRKKNDPYPCERYMILNLAASALPKPNAMKIYRAYSTDRHPVVRRKAQKMLALAQKS